MPMPKGVRYIHDVHCIHDPCWNALETRTAAIIRDIPVLTKQNIIATLAAHSFSLARAANTFCLSATICPAVRS